MIAGGSHNGSQLNMAPTLLRGHLPRVAIPEIQIEDMGTLQPNLYQISSESVGDYYPVYSDTFQSDWDMMAMMMMVMKRGNLGNPGNPEESGNSVLNPNDRLMLKQWNGTPPGYIVPDGSSNATDGLSIDPSLLGAGTVDELPKGNGGGTLSPSPPDPSKRILSGSRARRSDSSKPRIYCEARGCGKVYGRRSEMRRHFQGEHEGRGGGNCRRCRIFIKRKDNLQKHEANPTKACLRKMKAMAAQAGW
ncbi:hypothetical protein C7212DRAFT_363839 [Tuber magnatum]|uniref:C2H2-type domain-containing protein n=1 Tax=Tuber magnatum TaxID=42249 RepID=A0A317SPP6_9PEZI|nr:hypothetical protein C7212DRAFT_363839 [Tuber magnatum]